MKNFTKILLAVLSLIMIISMVACGDDKPEETPAETPAQTPAETPKETPAETPAETPEETPEDTKAPETPEDTKAPETPADTTPPVVDVPTFADAVKGIVTGATLDGKIVITNGDKGTAAWVGSDIEGYVIKSGKPDAILPFSSLLFPIAVTEDSVLKFNVKVDCGEGECAYILVDEVGHGLGDLTAGEHAVEIPLTKGQHTIAIAYQKDADAGNDAGADAAYVSKMTVEKATFSLTPVNLEMTLDKPAGFDGDNVTTIQVEDAAYVLNGASKSETGDAKIVYIKKSHKYPRVSVKFTAPADGTYDILVVTGCKDRTAAGACATGLVQIDNGQKYYVKSPCTAANGAQEYFPGITVELKAGEHDIHFYLADDFNDSDVKSIYFDSFSFVKK